MESKDRVIFCIHDNCVKQNKVQCRSNNKVFSFYKSLPYKIARTSLISKFFVLALVLVLAIVIHSSNLGIGNFSEIKYSY